MTHAFSFFTTQGLLVQPNITTTDHDWQLRLTGHRVLIVTDKGLVKTGVIEPIAEQLEKHCIVVIYDEVEADPPIKQIERAILFAQQHHISFVIGLGGGSSLDTAKLIALMTHSEQSLSETFGVNKATGIRLPLIQIPTTAGTGSEVTPIAIVTTESNEKIGIVSPLLYPDLAILDASLTINLPPHITAMVGIDAMVHAIEAFTSKIKHNPISSALAKEAFQKLFFAIDKAIESPYDLTARSDMLVGACLAGMAFANAPVGAVHALAYPIGGLFHVPHGLSNALVLIPVLQYNLAEATKQYAQLAQLVIPDIDKLQDEYSQATALIDALQKLIARMPIAQRLTEVGITQNDLPKMVEDAMKIERLLINNPREMTAEACLAIYQSVL